jgi:probable O-glycosylation ligase (exosortase A-associated)
MLRGLYLFLVYMVFFVLGISAPFVFSLGYIWVDCFYPQLVGGEILSLIPASFIIGSFAIGSFVLIDRNKVRPTVLSGILVLFAIWVTFTTFTLAEDHDMAVEKWNYAVKTILFGAFIPCVFRTRVQIEAFLQIFLCALIVHFLPVGIKTVVSGGGYGRELGVINGNRLISEGSTLSAVSLMLVPIALWLRNHSVLIPRTLFFKWLYIGLIAATIAAAIGTFERTGLVGMVVLAIGVWIRARRKVLYGAVIVAAALCVFTFTSVAWNSRISTIGHYSTERSALARILVWKWTINYASSHPFGGGFNSYVKDKILVPDPERPNDAVIEQKGIAFHNIYIEVLGEQGYVGLAMFLSVIGLSLVNLQRTAQRTKTIEALQWAHDLAYALQVSLAILLVCGSFIGIAFQPMLYYLFGISTCLWENIRRNERMVVRADASKPEPALSWATPGS